LATIQHAICRDKEGKATTIVGAVIDQIKRDDNANS
jgi:hypothetical protein